VRAWTADDVRRRLVDEFRQLQGRPVFSPRKNEFLLVDYTTGRIVMLDVIAASAHYLGRESTARKMVLAAARAEASHASIRELCREMGWPRRTFQRRCQAACSHIAREMNAHSPDEAA
jgi:hypothetical protein